MSKYDVVVWGATGFTGRLVAEYLSEQAPSGLRWAVGGRDRAKLERIRETLGAAPDIVTGNAADRSSMDALAGTARVVLSTVGPFARLGTPLVEACVEAGTDYCDITGEPHWIRHNIDRLHARALETGARIVHCCGFDSIPSDIGVWMLHDHLRERHGTRLARAQYHVARVRGGFSGGTVASILDLLEQASGDREVRRVLGNPYALNPEGERRGPDGPDQRGARFDADVGRWTAPFLMAGINTRIVRRSNALLGYPYGRGFRYAESVLARGPLGARIAGAGIALMTLGGVFVPTRWLMRRFLPAPGRGPSRNARESGHFEIRLLGWSAGEAPVPVRGRVTADRDPGYGATSRMVAESALCLALDDPASGGGILTPTACMGPALLRRLRERSVLELEVEGPPAPAVGISQAGN